MERTPVLLVGVDPETETAIRAALAAGGRETPVTTVAIPDAIAPGAISPGAGTDPQIVIVGAAADHEAAILAVRAVVGALPHAVVFAIGSPIPDVLAGNLIHAGAEDYLTAQEPTLRALPRILGYAAKRRRANDQFGRLSAQRGHVEALLATLFELSATPMVLAEEDGTVLIANGAFAEVFGIAGRAAVGRRLGDDLFPGLGAGGAEDTAPQRLRADGGPPVFAAVRRAGTSMERTIVTWAFVPQPDPAPPEDRLAALVGGEPRRIAAGRIQLVRIEGVRARFGDRWGRWSARIYDIAERVIRNRLVREDVVSRNVQGDFVICFATLDGEAAWFKARAIQRELERQIIGEDADGSVGAVVVETHEIDLSPDDAAPGIDIAEMIGAKLTEAAERLRADEQSVLAGLYATAGLETARVETASGDVAPVLVATFDPHSRATLGRLAQATPDPAHLCADIDMMLLGRVANALPGLLGRRPELLLVATVHASTLTARALRDRLFALCHQMPEPHRRALILRVRGLPPDMLPSRAVEILSPLRALSRFRILAVPRIDAIGLPLRECGVSLIEVDCGHLLDTAEREAARVDRLLGDLRRNRTHLVVRHVPDRAAATRAAALGARFLAFDPAPPRSASGPL